MGKTVVREERERERMRMTQITNSGFLFERENELRFRLCLFVCFGQARDRQGLSSLVHARQVLYH
jgi:hypothetical protein